MLVVDGAQAAPHRPVDVQALGCDFYAISGHKMCGPGVGRAVGAGGAARADGAVPDRRRDDPRVSLERTTWNELPWKFEAGTPAIAECIGLGAAVDYLQRVGLEAIAGPRAGAAEYGTTGWPRSTGSRSSGRHRSGARHPEHFNVADIHPHDVAQVLDADAICVRAGHHCAQPVVDRYGVAATTRASVYLYNTTDDLDALASGIERVSASCAEGRPMRLTMDDFYRENILDHYRNPRNPGIWSADGDGRGGKPAVRRRAAGRAAGQRRVVDRRALQRPRLRDQPGGRVDALRRRQGQHGRGGERDRQGRTCWTSSGSR